jgi:hypothetical protein
MRTLLRATIATAFVAVAPMLIACGKSDSGPSSKEIRRVEIEARAAYSCMPKNLRRELRVLNRRHEARLAELARTKPAGPGFQPAVLADPVRKRILRRARGIYAEYLPGGRGYNAACYFREREKAKTKLQSQPK